MYKRVGLLLAITGLIAALYSTGLLELAGNPERARAILEGLGIWAPVLYVLAFSLLEPFFVPGLAFIIPGALVFPFPELFVLSWLGSIGAGIVGFGFARFMGRDFVDKRLPPRFRKYDQRLASHGLQTVILVRLTLFLTPPAHWLLGLSQVRFGTFVLGTVIGFIPGIAISTYLVAFMGESLAQWLQDRPPEFFALIALSILVAVIIRRRFARRRKPTPRDPLEEGPGPQAAPTNRRAGKA
ncbi:VTT domain-containing protein [Myxococcota bacterium]|nr:VTT domain-containing protein [Myxococcota bacterium]